MFKEGKEIISIDNKQFIRLSDAMQVIAPTANNSSRWFRQHQEAAAILAPETFVYSDERFPGKKNRVWITVPEGFQALAQACIKAPRLKVLEGVENRIAPFVKNEDYKDDGQNAPLVEVVGDEVDIEFDTTDDAKDERSMEVGKRESRDTETAAAGEKGISCYKETEEKLYGMTVEFGIKGPFENKGFSIPPSTIQNPPSTGESYVDFLKQMLSDLVARYYIKMCWLKRAQAEAPEEIHAAFADLTNTLHDTLIGNVIVDILKYKEPKAPGADQVEKYLSMGYEISFETHPYPSQEGTDKEGILCRLLSEAIGVNVVAANWREALVEAIKQIPDATSPAPDSLYVSKPNGSVELVNDKVKVEHG